MDKQIILDKLSSLKRCVERVESKVPKNSAVLKIDFDLQDIISLNLQRAVQVSVDIAAHINAGLDDARPPASMTDSFDNLNRAGILSESLCIRMKKSVGYRNIAVHEYSTINWDLVFSVATKNLNDFREFSKSILTWLKVQS
ncbi:conserved hypothetical protein [Desulforapulum autotrophicum HRM2]|uniref:DUF86 domain-containing protein n=1 Tax=Desulforapulum autotrophicum (strain ATCC 43914 / DSM 3382 / VKM B-1955 / HRM2) TaxID=177437 RepID=C0QCK1_DESAH|nr:DUF86 domain-containing protein [Desulforapulum autotrophicum]ACN15078.1 conserved hypothetical protein [Desulforapulum autotrophicum HRM2]